MVYQAGWQTNSQSIHSIPVTLIFHSTYSEQGKLGYTMMLGNQNRDRNNLAKWVMLIFMGRGVKLECGNPQQSCN